MITPDQSKHKMETSEVVLYGKNQERTNAQATKAGLAHGKGAHAR